MTMHDDRKAVRNSDSADRKNGFRGLWGMAAMAAILVFGFVVWAMSGNRTNKAGNQPAATPPATTGSASVPAGSPSGSQPQGPTGATGPLNTGSGGAPAASPQGETPPGMQSNPQGSSGTTSGPAR